MKSMMLVYLYHENEQCYHKNANRVCSGFYGGYDITSAWMDQQMKYQDWMATMHEGHV